MTKEPTDPQTQLADENERLTAELINTRRALAAVCTSFPDGTDIRFVMSAIIGICEHEDGPTVVRYIGHLERLLKEARAGRPNAVVTDAGRDGGGAS